MEFASFGLDARLSAALADRGFAVTTPVQSAVYPSVLRGEDLIACAQTGTGKTIAFLLPLMQRLLARPAADRGGTRVLVLAPTRELAVQIEEEFQGLAYHTPLSGAAVYGGVGMGPQDRALKGGVDVVVATPGRLIDHMRSGVRFDRLEVLILDEADRMLDMGFWPDVRRIVSALPAERQTLFFSATTSPDVMKAATQIMRGPSMVRIGGQTGLASTITHVGHVMPREEKAEWLAGFLRRAEGPTIVFVRTKRWADRLARRLDTGRLRVAALHADRTQSQRTAAVEGFKSGRYAVLVATDIAARGLDIDSVGHVVNYEVPTSVDTYVHRVGRTGRAEATGTAVTLVTPEEIGAVRDIERALDLELVTSRAN
ncbi:MAG: DEAD/DEAH box helicase [Vicinamibacterales bacterium]|nr:DEAD/DEAH box helicase [Vicinamibacterales bacterium]